MHVCAYAFCTRRYLLDMCQCPQMYILKAGGCLHSPPEIQHVQDWCGWREGVHTRAAVSVWVWVPCVCGWAWLSGPPTSSCSDSGAVSATLASQPGWLRPPFSPVLVLNSCPDQSPEKPKPSDPQRRHPSWGQVGSP